MKKLLSVILSILLTCTLLTACNANDDNGMRIGKVEQTNKELTIRIQDYEKILFESGINKFKEKYPDVKLNVEVVANDGESPENYMKKLTTDIMSGKGPDIVYMDTVFQLYSDVYKMMSSGVFADMNEFIENDLDFHIEDFNKVVFDGGTFQGKQYVIPLEYSIPIQLSTETIMKEADFDTSKCTDFFGYTDQIEKFLNTNKNNPIAPRVFTMIRSLFRYTDYMGIKMLNYEDKTVHINSPEFKKASEFYKLLYPQEILDAIDGENYTNYKQKKMLFENFGKQASLAGFLQNSMAVSSFDKPVPLPIRDINGGVQAGIIRSLAIRNNSANKQNAYNFIKIMLSPEVIENGIVIFDIPIRNSSAETIIEKFSEPGNVSNNDFVALSQEYRDEYMETINSITGTYFRNPWSIKLFEIMEPYYKGEKSYEECIKNAEDQLKIYISE